MDTPDAAPVKRKRPWWMVALGCGAGLVCAGVASPVLIIIAAGTPPPATPPQ